MIRSLLSTVIAVTALGATLAFAASPLAEAQQSLDAGKLDQVLFSLDGKTFQGDAQRQAAALLAHAARKSLSAKDPLFALQLAQRALHRDPDNLEALEIGARAFLAEQQFTPAEQLADRWMAAAPKTAAPRLFRAEIAEQEGEWDHALSLTAPLTSQPLDAEQRRRCDQLRLRAQGELQDHAEGMSRLRSLDEHVRAALAQAHEQERQGAFARAVPTQGVVIYGTSWCGFCKKARAYLTQKSVPFEDKDVEKDPEAAQELARKEAERHVHYGGVPIIDVRGTLVRGFDKPKLDALLGL